MLITSLKKQQGTFVADTTEHPFSQDISSEMAKTKKLVIIRGKGTKNETRIETDITLYWCQSLQSWVTVPENN
jgi:hypothetical protein